MGRLPLLLCLLVFGSCSGSPAAPGARPDGVLLALADPDSVELLALHPYPHELDAAGSELERLHGYGVLGRATLTDDDAANELLALVEGGIENSDGRVAACFNPRHGLRVRAGGALWEFLICYECLSMQVYRDGVRQDGHRTAQSVETQVTALFEASGLRIHGGGD